MFGLQLRGKTILVKPNLVEYIPGAEVNTNPLLVGAAAGAFLALGAKAVVVAEGPGHQRDTYLVLAQSGFASQLRDRKLSFVDLNRDDVRQVKVTTPFTGLDSLWVPQSILAADVVVSMPKVKTHHWAGVTLSMKNMFRNDTRLGLWLAEERSPLEGDRPEHPRYQQHDRTAFRDRGRHRRHGRQRTASGSARDLGRIVMSDDPVAADFTRARLMGFDPYRVSHLAQADQFLGHGDVARIEQLGEALPGTVRPFSVLPEFAHLIAGATS